ncbi:DUF2461 domain-containing protein [Mesonia sp. K7]|uniref:DUF2461 domain-containing protein n=1 Tax=Mesonia sp. K7 TaxID=2218606 RepID=UPI000DA87100|nr:DUF2461 domain-containing protein [Mesonia sp. K7]PZD78187.1 TIGR02453 family protein [Mesonia sp. K7]
MESINKEALSFLKQLKINNNREWFEENKPKFKKLESEMKTFYKHVESLMQQHDEIEKTKAFRIYRDVRFSKDKTPYKHHFAAHFMRKKPTLRGGYYLHIEPHDQSFLAVGFWSPEKNDLYRIRKEIESDADEFKAVVLDKKLQKYWGELEGKQLKTAPKGFDKEHAAINYINHKQFIFTAKFTDKEVLSENFTAKVNEHFKGIRPFFDYMTSVLTTDLNGVSLLK